METSVGVDGLPDSNWRLEVQREESKVRAAMFVFLISGERFRNDGELLVLKRRDLESLNV